MDLISFNEAFFHERENELVAIIEATQEVQATNGWKTLQSKVFDGITEVLSRETNTEAKKEQPDSMKLNRLAGQLKWSEKFSDLKKLEQAFRVELTQVRKQLYGKTEKES